TWCGPNLACSLRSAWLPGWRLLARTGRPVPGEELAWLAVLGGLLGHRRRPEPGVAEQPEPDVPAEQAQPVRLVHHADLSAWLPEQERVLGEGPGVARVRVVGPVQVPRRPPVRAVDAAVAGAGLEVLGDVVRDEHRNTAGAAVRECGLDDQPQVVLGGHVVDGVVDEHRVEVLAQADRAHV